MKKTDQIRELTGMQYSSIEFEHDIMMPMSDILRILALWVEDTDNDGIIKSVNTVSHPYDEDLFITTLIWGSF